MRSLLLVSLVLAGIVLASADAGIRLPGLFRQLPRVRAGDSPPVGCCLQTNAFSVNVSITHAASGNDSSFYGNGFIQVDAVGQRAFIAMELDHVEGNLPEQDLFVWYNKNATSGGFTQTFYVKGEPCYTLPADANDIDGLFGPYCWNKDSNFSGFEYVLLGSTLLNVQGKSTPNTSGNGGTGEYMAVESATCLPVIDTQIGWGEDPVFYQQAIFFDPALRVVAPDAFKTPTGCKPLPQRLAHHANSLGHAVSSLKGRPQRI